MRIEHTLSQQLLKRRGVQVLVVGAGGTGSAVLMGLPYLHQAMRVWGHPYGLAVTIMDPDTVSATNCVRQPFAQSDIGMNKATVLVNRINTFWGISWTAVPSAFTEQSVRGYDQTPDLVIGCVDTRAARKAVHNALTLRSQGTSYWLDIGNNAASGQYVLGQPLNMSNRRKAERLRTVAELYPEIADADAARTSCPAARPSRHCRARNHLSIRPSPQARWPCCPNFSVMERSPIMARSITPKRGG
jgi:PRTRC genetic system ThiF family protein